jgi:hypothetical protein
VGQHAALARGVVHHQLVVAATAALASVHQGKAGVCIRDCRGN